MQAFNNTAMQYTSKTNDNFKLVLKAVTEYVMPTKAVQKQKRYMRKFLQKPRMMKDKDFVERVIAINDLLVLFPDVGLTLPATKIPEDEILDLLESAMPLSWQRHMILQGFDPVDGTVKDLVDFCERLENTEDLDPRPLKKENGKEAKKSDCSTKKRVRIERDSDQVGAGT